MTPGVSLLLVMLLNVIGPVAPNLYYYWSVRKKQKAAEDGETERIMTQEEMNNVFMGPEFQVMAACLQWDDVPSRVLHPDTGGYVSYVDFTSSSHVGRSRSATPPTS